MPASRDSFVSLAVELVEVQTIVVLTSRKSLLTSEHLTVLT